MTPIIPPVVSTTPQKTMTKAEQVIDSVLNNYYYRYNSDTKSVEKVYFWTFNLLVKIFKLSISMYANSLF